jgi:antitoxin MazE
MNRGGTLFICSKECIVNVETFMKVKIQKWGNSLAVRIPKSFAVETQMKQDAIVDLSLLNGDIVVKLHKEKPKYTLDDLLAGITDENIHAETDWGRPVGKEIL